MKYYRQISLSFALTFGIVGLIFLFFPDGALKLFNWLSQPLGMAETPETGSDFYLILAAAYMYLATLLAVKMFQFPDNTIYPLLLANGKLASSVISLYLFISHAHYLIYIANCLIDGAIGFTALWFYNSLNKSS